jgi:nitrile hydratase subunit beta
MAGVTDGVADIGGARGWGAVRAPGREEPAVAEPREGRASALTLPGRNLDAFRHELGRLDRTASLDDGCCGRRLHAVELMPTARGAAREAKVSAP